MRPNALSSLFRLAWPDIQCSGSLAVFGFGGFPSSGREEMSQAFMPRIGVLEASGPAAAVSILLRAAGALCVLVEVASVQLMSGQVMTAFAGFESNSVFRAVMIVLGKQLFGSLLKNHALTCISLFAGWLEPKIERLVRCHGESALLCITPLPGST